jgi:hypothetical protein
MLDLGILAPMVAVVGKQLVDNPGHVIREVTGTSGDIMHDNSPRRDPYSGPVAQVLDPFIILAEDLSIGSGAKHKLNVPGL